MFLLVGHSGDACLTAVQDRLRLRGRTATIVASPFAWPGQASSCFPVPCVHRVRPNTSSPDLDVAGVLCRGIGPSAAPAPNANGWTRDDLDYARTEADAALLGWLSAIECRVVDRLPAWLWYNTRPALLGWGATLARCGLPPLDAVTTDDPAAIDTLSRGAGAAWMPILGSGARYPIAGDPPSGLIAMARHAPLHLSTLHVGAWRGCVLGARNVVWDDETPPMACALDLSLRTFAAAVALDAVELVVTGQPPGQARTVDVAAPPRFNAFGPLARAAIAEGITGLLEHGIGP
jgi:hypothetical protein